MNELVNFLKNFSITIAVISIPLLIMWLIEQYKIKRVKKTAKEISQILEMELRESVNCNFKMKKMYMRYVLRNVRKGLLFYAFFTLPGIIRYWARWGEMVEYLSVSLFFLVFILFFVLRDVLRVAPWKRMRIKKVVECNDDVSNFIGDRYILYYDDKKQIFEVAKMEIPSGTLTDDEGCLLAVVAEKRKRMVPIFVVNKKDKEKI
nr:hypothetical protein [Lachnospiraceae bacterium]